VVDGLKPAVPAVPWPADKVSRWPIDRLKAYARNPRTHTAEQVAKLARSLEEFGWTNPVLVDEAGEIIAGHGRVLAAEQLGWDSAPVMVARGWNDDQKRAYRIADNRLALDAGWDDELLAVELRDLQAAEFDLELTGMTNAELAQLLIVSGDAEPEPEPPPPDAQAVGISRPGEVWLCGSHRVICGDSTDPATLAALMGEAVAALVHADPPYGMGKESDGVANDNLYGDKLDAFQLAWWRACRPHIAPNASVYIWGAALDLWRLWWRAGLGESEPLTLRNEIVWDKGSIAGMRSEDLTQYPEATERALFFQLGRHVFLINQTKDDYWEGWEPLRLWLCGERDRMGWGPADVKRICDNHMYGHWFGRSQWAWINRENYEKLQAAAAGRAFVKPYDELLEDYRELARQFNGDVRDPRHENYRAVRPYFDNTHDTMRDVWQFPRVTGDDRFGHATPKPVAMIARCLLSSAREGDVVLEPFGGTGTTLIAAERTRRRCFIAELEPVWADVIVRRWQSMTGGTAVLESTGETFEAVERARSQA
jgi:DNA modification methylase